MCIIGVGEKFVVGRSPDRVAGDRPPPDSFDRVFDLEQYLAVGVDAAAYFVVAITSTSAYVLKLGLSLVGGSVETDVADLDADLDSTASFSLFSVLSVLAFLMGASWIGLAGRLNWGLGSLLAGTLAAGFGAALMTGSAGLMYAVQRMTHVPRYNLRSAVGRTGTVYLTVPAKGQGEGQVEIDVSGRRKIVAAVSEDYEIPAFAAARVIGVRKGNVFVLESAEVTRARPGRSGRR